MPDNLIRNYVIALAASALALGGCKERPAPAPQASASSTADDAKRSIFRPEFQVEPIEGAVAPKPLELQVTFPDGAELSEQALADLATVVASPQLEDGGAIVLGGHSDAGGNDEVNLRVSRDRANAVRDWLVEQGVEEDRITVIAFGEQNPVRPNALPDGSPNEAGRAANRRVEILVQAGPSAAPTKEPTLAETLSEPAAGDTQQR